MSRSTSSRRGESIASTACRKATSYLAARPDIRVVNALRKSHIPSWLFPEKSSCNSVNGKEQRQIRRKSWSEENTTGWERWWKIWRKCWSEEGTAKWKGWSKAWSQVWGEEREASWQRQGKASHRVYWNHDQ